MPVFTDHLLLRGVRQNFSTDTESTEQKKLSQPCSHTICHAHQKYEFYSIDIATRIHYFEASKAVGLLPKQPDRHRRR